MVVRATTTLPQQVFFIKFMVRVSLVLLAVIIIGSLGAGRLQFAAYGWLGPAIIIVFCLGAVILARLFAAHAGRRSGTPSRSSSRSRSRTGCWRS
jgi:uncharacterized integral membrane protein